LKEKQRGKSAQGDLTTVEVCALKKTVGQERSRKEKEGTFERITLKKQAQTGVRGLGLNFG